MLVGACFCDGTVQIYLDGEAVVVCMSNAVKPSHAPPSQAVADASTSEPITLTSKRFSILKDVVPGDRWIHPAKWSPSVPLATVALERGRQTNKHTEHFLVVANDERGRVRLKYKLLYLFIRCIGLCRLIRFAVPM